MDDSKIIDLYWRRDESAIAETAKKYGNYLYTISKNIVSAHEDAEECVQDTYKATWDAIPPHRPDIFKAFLTKLTRRISISRLRYLSADKRNSGYDMAFDELENSLAGLSLEKQVENHEISRVVNDFVRALKPNDRKIFVLWYFYFEPVKSIAAQTGYSESKVKSQLYRLRKKLALALKKEGIFMKADIILDAISELDDELLVISEAKKRHLSPKPIAVAAIFALIFALATPTLATNDTFYNIVYTISPEIAQSLKPVRMQDEHNGIVMEVISADIHDSEAEIYIGLTDIEGDRIDETTDLFDSYSINRPFDSAASCKRISYDEQSKTATFLIHISQWNGEKINGSKITFTVGEFLSGKQDINELPIEIDTALLKSEAKMQKSVRFRGGGGAGIDIDEVKNTPCLVPFDEPLMDFGGASLTAVGRHEGRLHIQMHYEDILDTDNHGSVHLKDKDGNIINCTVNIAFWDKDKSGSFEEYIFDIPQENAENYEIFADLVLCDKLTEGPWQVTFPLKGE